MKKESNTKRIKKTTFKEVDMKTRKIVYQRIWRKKTNLQNKMLSKLQYIQKIYGESHL